MKDLVMAERARCIWILHDRANGYDKRKLFNLARALSAVADEIAVGI
jgi:hypothetical protein